MARRLPLFLLLLGLVVGTHACVDGRSPTEFAAGERVSLALKPVFATSGVAQAEAGPISVVRLTAVQTDPERVLVEERFEVSPEADGWALDLDIPVPTEGDATVRVTIELISVADGGEVVEWSGRTAPISLNQGAGSPVQQVTVFRGPVDNLAVESVSVEGVESMKVNASAQLSASVQTSDAGASPTLYWESLTPDVLEVDPATGEVTGLAPGAGTVRVTAGNASDEATVQVVPGESDLAITKSASESEVGPGDELTFTVSVTNAGPDLAELVRVSDDLPDGLSVESVEVSAGALGDGDGVPVWTINDMAPGDAASMTLTTRVEDGLAEGAELVNTATVALGEGQADPNAEDNAGSAGATVRLPRSDLAVTKTASADEVDPGAEVTWTVTVSNAGPASAGPVTVTDDLPADFVLEDVSASDGSVDGATWTLAELEAGGSATMTVSGHLSEDAEPGSLVTNTASAAHGGSRTDPEPDNDEASASVRVTRPEADVSVTKTADEDEVDPGDPVAWTVTVSNAGPAAAAVHVSDALPDGFVLEDVSISAGELAAEGDPSSWTLENLAAGASATMTVTGAVDEEAEQGAELVNRAEAEVGERQRDPDGSNNAAEATVIVQRPEADLVIEKLANRGGAEPGQQVSFFITVTNDGPADTEDATVTESLPAGLEEEDVDVTVGRVEDGVWTIPSLPAGESAMMTVKAAVGADLEPGTVLTNTARVAAGEDQSDPNEANDEASASVTVVEPPPEEEGDADTRRPGDIAIYKNQNAWSARVESAFQQTPFNFTAGEEYEARPMWMIGELGIPQETSLVIITSASSEGAEQQIDEQKVGAPNLEAWIRDGGWLVIHAGDNSSDDYIVPGLSGPVDDILDRAVTCSGSTLAAEDHPIIRGPDGELGTGDDLDNDNIDLHGPCHDNHGSLDGLLPDNAQVLLTEQATGKPTYATYPLGNGRVIVTTLTMEFAPTERVQLFLNHLYWPVFGTEITVEPGFVQDLIQPMRSLGSGEFDPERYNSDGTLRKR